MATCPEIIGRLIERFDQQADRVRSADYNETQLRIDFVNPMWSVLGWDMDNHQGFAEQYREVVHEDRVKVAGQTKAPDYSFRIGGTRKFFLEAKKPFVVLKDAWEPAYQLRRYGWSAKLAVSVLTNFAELAIYDCRIAPKQMEKAKVARREFITHHQYADRWDFIEGTFSKRAVLQGEFDRYCATTKGRGRAEFDDTFLEEIEEWRKTLASNLALRNESLDQSKLNFAVQRIIDRVVFLRMAEDRGTENTGQLQALLNGEQTYARLGKLFRDADARYNSGLFHFNVEKGRDESPDTLTPTLEVDDKTLKDIIRRLYYPESPYEFTVVTADILGSIYERFLGKVITLTTGHRAKVEEKPEVRKAGGVYYTPTYIVDYIVRNTVGKLLDGKTPKDAAKLKVIDPACGSGSFLIGAYQFLLDWHLEQYRADDPARLAAAKNPVLRPGSAGDWCLTIAERKRILVDNIHGVDLDAAAVEVTKLNLLLKCLEGETRETLGFDRRLFRERALPDLGHNVLCGNSLIGTDIMATDAWKQMSEGEKEKINPFDYERGFTPVMKRGGFDAVIGNPPYIQLSMAEYYSEVIALYLRERFSSSMGRLNTFGLFFEVSQRRLVRDGGTYGYIVPSTLISQDYYSELRGSILQNSLRKLVVYNYHVFSGAVVEPATLIAEKSDPAKNVVDIEIWSDPETVQSRRIAQSVFANNERLVFTVNAGSEELSLRKKLEEKGEPFGTLANLNQAIALKGDRSASLRRARKNKNCVPVIDGREIHRYTLQWSGSFLEYDVEKIHSCKRRDIFDAKEKIFFRRVGEGLIATYDSKQFYALNTLVVVTPKASARLPVKFALAWLNSRLTNWYYATFLKSSKTTFSEIQARQVGRIPFPVRNDEESLRTQEQIIELVNRMLSLQPRLSAEQHPNRREQLQREIDATDRQIDQLVYQLYGLTEDEIRIVEEATT